MLWYVFGSMTCGKRDSSSVKLPVALRGHVYLVLARCQSRRRAMRCLVLDWLDCVSRLCVIADFTEQLPGTY